MTGVQTCALPIWPTGRLLRALLDDHGGPLPEGAGGGEDGGEREGKDGSFHGWID